ncbi:MAG: hypothetical protein ABJB69_02780 [Spartobacteria bacterium]
MRIRNIGLSLIALTSAAFAQETPAPTPVPSPSESATIVPEATATATPPLSTRSVRISFLPPPLEGTISLGIYDTSGKLVRVLLQEADVEEFDVGADSLITKWDGRNDHDEDLPAGKYHARGYMVGRLKVEDLGKAATPPADPSASDHLQVKLVSNPLAKDAKLIVDLAVGFDEENIFLKTADGLPLFNVIESPKLVRALITKNSEKAVDVWADGGTAIEQVRVSNIDKMMAFDCGEIELK